jgi:hypothetical protein
LTLGVLEDHQNRNSRKVTPPAAPTKFLTTKEVRKFLRHLREAGIKLSSVNKVLGYLKDLNDKGSYSSLISCDAEYLDRVAMSGPIVSEFRRYLKKQWKDDSKVTFDDMLTFLNELDRKNRVKSTTKNSGKNIVPTVTVIDHIISTNF